MGALSEIYVDPAINANTGSGTIGSPYGDLQHAFNTATRDTTNGNRINIKAGTAEVPTGSISYATFGNPTSLAPCIWEGYTSAAGDGGIGDINGNVGNFTIANDLPFTHFRNLILRNTGTATIITLGQDGHLVDCEIHTSTNATASINTKQYGKGRILGCNIYNVVGHILVKDENDVAYCYLITGPTHNFSSYALQATGDEVSSVFNNIITVTGGIYGIVAQGRIFTFNNSILSAAGTAAGIYSGSPDCAINNNLIEGFSGVGGKGIEGNKNPHVYLNNAVFNCTTPYSTLDERISDGNETLGATPFAKSGSNTFANRFTYFAPVNTGNVWAGAYPVGSGLDKGAVQHIAAAGGGGGRPEFRGSNL